MNNKFNEYTPSIKPSANDIIFKDKKELNIKQKLFI